MRAPAAVLGLLLVAMTPTAGAFTFEATSPAQDPYAATLTGTQPLVVPLTVLINCTVGDVSVEDLRVEFAPVDADGPLEVHVADDAVTKEGPVACQGQETYPFSTNATLRFTRAVDARSVVPAAITYEARAGFDAVPGDWEFNLTQAFDPEIGISMGGGFTETTAPGGAFAFPIRVVNAANAPVRAFVEVRTLSRYAPDSVRQPPPVDIDWPDGGQPVERVLVVTGRAQDGVGNVNATIALELRVQVVPLGIEFQEFFTERRLFVVHVNVVNEHLRPPGDAAAPGPGAGLLVAAVLVAAAVLRARHRSRLLPRS